MNNTSKKLYLYLRPAISQEQYDSPVDQIYVYRDNCWYSSPHIVIRAT